MYLTMGQLELMKEYKRSLKRNQSATIAPLDRRKVGEESVGEHRPLGEYIQELEDGLKNSKAEMAELKPRWLIARERELLIPRKGDGVNKCSVTGRDL